MENLRFDADREPALIRGSMMRVPRHLYVRFDPKLPVGSTVTKATLKLFANLRPVRPSPALLDASPLRRDRIEGTNLLVVRELTGGIYFGDRGRRDGGAFDTCDYSVEEIERIARVAFGAAKSRVTSVDKANVLETSRLWRRVTEEVVRGEFPALKLEHVLVDACAMHLIRRPADFDVIVTENMFGDILSDLGAALIGGMGVAPSGDISDRHAMFQPCHGTAPDIAGTGKANPTAMFLSAAMMLDWLGERHRSNSLAEAARILEQAVRNTFQDGAVRLFEFGGSDGTASITRAVLARIGSA